ncbi:hypothetical protein PIB30_036897 [Stylosanthes scabra]|uniref:BHLH domain-containing protein n=1 Tax=Stylosanthes scabra TaxID=79078 RepID=A0ABU6YAV2_9FABA|nr:hypothetical protein [Stylosanthes scabra]
MENCEDYKNYWETNMFLETQELDTSWPFDDAFSGGYYDSSSPDGGASSAASKNIVSERNRRKKLNERLFALRAVVPNITKMDKASIIKDAIEYIEHLHEQERRIQDEIMELESASKLKNPLIIEPPPVSYHFHQDLPVLLRSKKNRPDTLLFDTSASSSSSRNNTYFPIELIDLRVTYKGEKIFVISLTCSKRTDTMVKICEVFESLKLKIITANITSFSGTLLKTLFVEADEEEKDNLQIRIQTAIAALNDPQSPMSI